MVDIAKLNEATICIVGLGYIGMPLAEAFSKTLKVVGFDIDKDKVERLQRDYNKKSLIFTVNPTDISQADIIIICVPTPVTRSKEPDLAFVVLAAETVSHNLKTNSVVILESTVYPGVTEEVVKPILEKSGLKAGRDFKIAYCPERINPGDEDHTIDKITKVVAGMDEETTEIVAELYRRITPKVYQARSIKTAEAAKAIENVQRDLNIALVNELSIIFSKLGLSTEDVLDAASTKWNFHRYSPGLVGGHCIPVDPYYLVYKAEEMGYHPRVILAGRAVNDEMPEYVARLTIQALQETGKAVKGSRTLIMGLTYKENVADTRETPARGIIAELKKNGLEIIGFDPLPENTEEFGVKVISKLEEVTEVNAVILAVGHTAFREITLDILKNMMTEQPVLIDIRRFFNAEEAAEKGFHYRSL
ncbi:nucleotide sugar dehydrogenase [Chloroflexota bacterium]